MILGVYSMRDLKTEFTAPTFSMNDAVALRSFEAAIVQAHGELFTHKEDFQLFRIGSFDTEAGVLFPEKLPVLIGDGKDVEI